MAHAVVMPGHVSPYSFRVDGEVANLLLTCYGLVNETAHVKIVCRVATRP